MVAASLPSAADEDESRIALREVLQDDLAVSCAYLFGSRARRTARRDSDVDVGVLFARERPATLLGLPTELEARLSARLQLPVQVVDLRRASADLVHRVLRDGVLLFERDRSARVRFEVRRRSEFFDLQPHFNRYHRLS